MPCPSPSPSESSAMHDGGKVDPTTGEPLRQGWNERQALRSGSAAPVRACSSSTARTLVFQSVLGPSSASVRDRSRMLYGGRTAGRTNSALVHALTRQLLPLAAMTIDASSNQLQLPPSVTWNVPRAPRSTSASERSARYCALVGLPTWSLTTLSDVFSRPSASIVSTKFFAHGA